MSFEVQQTIENDTNALRFHSYETILQGGAVRNSQTERIDRCQGLPR